MDGQVRYIPVGEGERPTWEALRTLRQHSVRRSGYNSRSPITELKERILSPSGQASPSSQRLFLMAPCRAFLCPRPPTGQSAVWYVTEANMSLTQARLQLAWNTQMSQCLHNRLRYLKSCGRCVVDKSRVRNWGKFQEATEPPVLSQTW